MEGVFRNSMNITDEIQASGVYFKEPEITNNKYSMFNTGGVECEVGEFIYGLVRMIKPERVLETGTHRGVGASYIGLGLRDNGSGILDTIEFIPELHEESQFNIDRLNISNYVNCILGDVSKTNYEDNTFDIIFLDTEPGLRFAELLQFWRSLKPGGFIMIHDINTQLGQDGTTQNDITHYPWGEVPEEIKDLFRDHELQSFHFKTPRGLYVGQKRSEEFYSNKYL